MKALKTLKKLDKERRCQVIVSLVVFRGNFRQLPQMIKMIGEFFGDWIYMLEIFPVKEYSNLFQITEDFFSKRNKGSSTRDLMPMVLYKLQES